MNKWFNDRNNQIMVFIIFLMSVLVIRLFSLTIVQGQRWKDASHNIRVRQIYTSAPRGEIRDRYGRVLAGNKPSFIVQIVRNHLNDEKINDIAIDLLSILEKNGDKYVDNFPIKIENDNLFYTYQKSIDRWLVSQGLPIGFTAEQAFNELKKRHEISDDIDKYEAQLQLQNKYGVYPPISVKHMKYLQDMEKDIFLGKYNMELDLSAEEAFINFRDKFEIEDKYNDSEARKIMMFHNELVSQGYRKYNPVKLAVGLSEQTAIILEEKRRDLSGIEVVVEPIRYYPYGSLASHILGYLGRISESEKEKYVNELGYLAADLIGKEGMEKACESSLKGIDGVTQVEVNASGKLIKVIEESTPQKGKNIYLTIDAELQKIAEEALLQALNEIQVGGTFQSKWGDYNYREAFPNANAGAVVALDVKSGDVLAMASYPDYDPNLFALGISEENWSNLQDQNPRDPLSPIPLFNIATRTAVQPGSTYKMLVGLAAIENGLGPYEKFYDGGAIKLGDRTFACSLWHSRRGSHGNVNLIDALEVSCNYYFYDIMSRYDYSKEVPIPIDMTIDDVMSLSSQFGLGEKTGIEIPEAYVGVPSQEKKIAVTKSSLRNKLKSYKNYYFQKEVVEEETLLEEKINTILSWTEENPSRNELIKRLDNVGILQNKKYELADLIKYSYFNMATWGIGDMLNLAIGQGEHAYTPLQMANYMATLVNGGYKNKVTLLKGVEDSISEEAVIDNEIEYQIDLNNPSNLEYIKMGMNKVTSGSRGTARGVFGSFEIQAGGKTGTAERSGKIQPKDEVKYIKKYLRWINPRLSFRQVEREMNRLLDKYPEKYNKNSAVRKAVVNLSNGRVSYKAIDVYKPDYEDFAWFVSFAPYDDPEIAVAVLLFQGGHGSYAAPVAKEVIAEYLGLNNEYSEFNLKNHYTE